MSDANELDGCALDFDNPDTNTRDGDDVDALIMFADCWDDPAAVEARRVALIELDTGNA